MTTSNPNVIPPAGGGDPDHEADVNQGDEAGPGSLVEEQLEGSGVPAAEDDPDTEASAPTDSVDADRERTGAE